MKITKQHIDFVIDKLKVLPHKNEPNKKNLPLFQTRVSRQCEAIKTLERLDN